MTVKTTISLPEEIFERMERELRLAKVSRSQFVAEAIEDRLKITQDRRIQAELDAVYGDEPGEEDREAQRFLRRASRSAVTD